MQWIELGLDCRPDDFEGAKVILAKLAQGGVAVEEWEDAVGSPPRYLVKAYLPLSRGYKKTLAQLKATLRQAGYTQTLHEKFLQQDEWFDSLKKNFKVMEIGDCFVIKPSWINLTSEYPGRIVIELDPGAAFGTGLHPTTRLCLLNLQKYLKTGDLVFDLGTGTGILAIAAVKLGAARVLACDIDGVAVKAAAANAAANQASSPIQFKHGTLSPSARARYRNAFDLVLANITARAISDLSPALAGVLKPGGTLIVSGIHPEGLDEVLIRLALAGLSLIDMQREGDWYAVIASKPAPDSAKTSLTVKEEIA